MSWTDEEIDKFAQEAAGGSSFEYKDEYWKEMEAILPPVSRKKDFLWFFTALLFVGLITVSAFYNPVIELNVSTINSQANTKELYNQTEQSEESADDNNGLIINSSEGLEVEEVNAISPQQHNMRVASSENPKVNTTSSLASTRNELMASTPALPVKSGVYGSDEKQETDGSTIPEQDILGEVNQLPLLGLPANDWIPKLEPKQFFVEQHLPMKATLYVGAFGGLSQSLITPSDKLSSSFGVGVGTQIQKGKWLLTAGVNGIWSNHQDLILNRRAKVYSFGSNEYSYDFDYKEIYSLEAEISLGYKFGRHTLNVGARPSYVVGTKVGISSSVNEKTEERGTYYGNMDGINRFGVKPFLGYAFDLSPSLKLGMNVGVQLMPMVQDGYLVGGNNNLPIDGQLYIRKSLRFKR